MLGITSTGPVRPARGPPVRRAHVPRALKLKPAARPRHRHCGTTTPPPDRWPDHLDVARPAAGIGARSAAAASSRRPHLPRPPRLAGFAAEHGLGAVGAGVLVVQEPLGLGVEDLGVAVLARTGRVEPGLLLAKIWPVVYWKNASHSRSRPSSNGGLVLVVDHAEDLLVDRRGVERQQQDRHRDHGCRRAPKKTRPSVVDAASGTGPSPARGSRSSAARGPGATRKSEHQAERVGEAREERRRCRPAAWPAARRS